MTGQRTDVNELLASCNLFAGVSRAALEAMATEKPVILAGGEGYIGLFTPDKLKLAVDTNFCCRGCEETTTEQLIVDITAFFAMPDSQRKPICEFGRELIVSDYSPTRMADDCLQAYHAAYRPKFRVVMSGYYGFKNIGDEAILQSINRNINEICDDISITVLTSDPQDTNQRYGYDSVNSFKVFDTLNAIRKCDALISGGGSLLQDITSTRSLIYYLFIIRMAKLMNKKVMLYANGIGPVTKKANRRRVRRVISRADVITLRDHASHEELRSMGVIRDDIRVTADPVFTMNGISSENARKLSCVPAKPFVTVSIRDWPNTGDFCKSIAAICDKIFDEMGKEIVFISMQSNRDVGISQKVQSLMKNPSHIIKERLSAEELIGVIGLADIMIAMRLHALIFAARMNVPFASILHDPKVSAYTSALAMPSAGDVTKFDSDFAMEIIKELLSKRDEYAKILEQKSTAFHNAAKEDPKLLVEMLGGVV
jgi:polysaccharide pyruvyl transferase CsaB